MIPIGSSPLVGQNRGVFEAVKLMKVGAKGRATCPPKVGLGMGGQGCGLEHAGWVCHLSTTQATMVNPCVRLPPRPGGPPTFNSSTGDCSCLGGQLSADEFTKLLFLTVTARDLDL